MNLDKAFGIHPQALQLRARRSEVLAANLAKAVSGNSTPFAIVPVEKLQHEQQPPRQPWRS